MRKKFLRIYANLPLAIRGGIIAVIDDEPMTWNVCWMEVKNGTNMAKRILKYLRSLEII